MQVLEISRKGIALSIEQGFIAVRFDGGLEKHPLDNLDCIILNSYGAQVSSGCLSRLCELNIPLLICGKNANPIGIMLSTSENVYRKERVQAQLSTSEPLRKQLWQCIVKAKIHNQLLLLKYLDLKWNDLHELEKNVLSGDLGNAEAVVARKYWQRLFGKSFIRDFDQPGINALLNYGYAILRASLCRYITAAGLLPEYGIHHRNAKNPFCLADDLMEPYRPFIDSIVYKMNDTGLHDLSPDNKRTLISVLDYQIPFNKKEMHLTHCIEESVRFLVGSFNSKKCRIKYPELYVKRVSADVDDGDV